MLLSHRCPLFHLLPKIRPGTMTSCEVHCLFSFPRLYRTQLCLSTVFLSYKIEDRKKKTGGKQDGITGMRL